MSLKHTFVICAYGDSPYLRECIESLKNQKMHSELILYTSTPSEYLTSLCQQYNLPLYTGKGGSIGKDWNQALSFVKTPYATIAHQDDTYEPTYSQEIIKQLTPDTLIAYSDYREMREGRSIEPTLNLRIKRLMLKTLAVFPTWKWWRLRVLSVGNPISCPAVTYNLKKLENFRFHEEMKVSLDWYAWVQLAHEKGSFEFITQSLMHHRIHADSETSQSIETNVRTKEDLEMYQLFWPKPIAACLMSFYSKSQETNQ